MTGGRGRELGAVHEAGAVAVFVAVVPLAALAAAGVWVFAAEPGQRFGPLTRTAGRTCTSSRTSPRSAPPSPPPPSSSPTRTGPSTSAPTSPPPPPGPPPQATSSAPPRPPRQDPHHPPLGTTTTWPLTTSPLGLTCYALSLATTAVLLTDPGHRGRGPGKSRPECRVRSVDRADRARHPGRRPGPITVVPRQRRKRTPRRQ